MANRSDLRFLGTGKPMNVNTNPYIDRSASSKGVRFSGAKTRSDLDQLVQSENNPDAKTLGKSAVSLQRATGTYINVFA